MDVNTRGHYVCSHCGTTRIPEGIDRDGVRVLETERSGLACSRCGALLAHAMVDEYQVEYCMQCRGILVARQDFARLVRRRRAWASGEAVTPAPADSAELRPTIACPKCHTRMGTDWYYGPGNVVLNRCGACDLVWLDDGELKQIVDAPGADRGSRDLS